jgi:hypothetical protein
MSWCHGTVGAELGAERFTLDGARLLMVYVDG